MAGGGTAIWGRSGPPGHK